MNEEKNGGISLSMIYRRERPKLRKIIINLCTEFGWTLEELLDFTSSHVDDDLDWLPVFSISKTMRIQARKMLEEGQFKTGKEIQQEQQKENLLRSVGLIK